MRCSVFLLAAFSSAVLAASAATTNPESDLSSILEALRDNNPEDAEAAASAMKIKLRRRDPVPEPQINSASDLNAILAALEANNPDDAAAARQNTKRQTGQDLNSILAALEENSPEDAQAAKQIGGGSAGGNAGSAAGSFGNGNGLVGNAKRQEDLNSILAALEENSPEDAAAAREGGSIA